MGRDEMSLNTSSMLPLAEGGSARELQTVSDRTPPSAFTFSELFPLVHSVCQRKYLAKKMKFTSPWSWTSYLPPSEHSPCWTLLDREVSDAGQ